jgi:hypothetical protein
LPKQKAANNLFVKISIVFFVFGVLSIVSSVYSSSQILAFTGLGLTFWGVLFLLIQPKSYVEGNLLISTAYPEYSTIDRIINDLECEEKAYYIPSYPNDAAVPEHLKGLKDPVVFISTEKSFHMPSIEDISQGKFLLPQNKGTLITPPGISLLKQIEKKMNANLTGVGISDVCEVLPRVILENFAIAKDLTMNIEEERTHLTIKDSIYKNLYLSDNASKSVHFLGCPIASAIACLLAQASGKIVTISETKLSLSGLTIETEYQIVG